MKKLSFCFLILLVFTGIINSQEKWVQENMSTWKRQVGAIPKVQPNPDIFIPSRNTIYLFSPFGVNAVSPNFRVLPNSNQQDEVILVSWRQNPMLMFGSANTSIGSVFGQGCYVTTNGGVNWYGTDLLPNMPGSTSDPAPAIDKDGRIIFTTLNTMSTAFMIGNYSTDNGVTFSTPYTIYSGSSDKNLANTDDVPTSPYYGRTYVVWTKWTSPYPAVISYTTNGGVSWSTMYQINSSPSGLSQGTDVVVGHLGQVYVTWSAQSGSVSDYVGFAKSTNGGTSFTVTENAFDVNGMRSSSFNGWGVRVNDFPRIDVDKSGGARHGWIYIVDCEKNLSPAGSDPDIILHRSTNEGLTWSSGIRVNQDAMNNGKVQFFPAIRVDEYGGLNVVYYDNRNFPSVGDSCDVYVSRSIDGGNTWTDIKVSDHSWKPAGEPGMGTYMGDYIGITSGNNKVWPFWFDNKSGSFQAWTCSIDLGPSINHTPLTNTELTTGTRQVLAQIIPAGSGINPSQTKLFFTKNPTIFTDSVVMTHGTGNNWTANITLSGPGTYRYYLKTIDSINRVATAPGGAPANYFSFIASPDTIKPVITHTPLANVPKVNWPVSTSAVVTDNIGVDSVWVRWYKNNTGTGIKHFKLLPTGGNNYSATFNSVNSDVLVGDSIFYRVFARDNSSGHNTDSTALYQFKIINQVNVTIGTGTTAIGWPYYTFYMDSRTDMLYLGSEIGIPAPGAYITKIGFDVVSAASQVMNGFQIKMQNTTATSITAFTSTNWTIAYNGTYSVPGSGWQLVTLQTPFYYTGGSNLLIEICFNNSSYTSNSTVNGAAATGRNVHQHSDLSSGDGCTAITTPGTTYTQLPNIQLVMNPGPTGIEQKGNEIPTKYELAQNYPNPFNPTTKINFAIPKQGMVTLKVYDVLGREVANLVNEVKTAGNYIVDFDASALSSGVYFYKIDVNGFSDVKRMMLIK
jgi:hypothetical protein